MAKKFVVLDFSFMFEPDTTWQTLSDFEADLAKFFNEHGAEAEIVQSMSGQIGRRILLVKKMDKLDEMAKLPKEKPLIKKAEKVNRIPREKVGNKFYIPTGPRKSQASGLKYRIGRELSKFNG